MERWELIERYVLLAVGAALLALAGWLAFAGNGLERFAFIALLLPCIYWVFWQALYEDKLETDEPPSTGERVMHAIWLWTRRLVFGGIAVLLAWLAAITFEKSTRLDDLGGAAVSALLSFMSGWVAIFGSGRGKSMSDDRAVHRKRMERYK